MLPPKFNFSKSLSQSKEANEPEMRSFKIFNDTKRLSQTMPWFLMYKNILLCHSTNVD